METKPVRSSRAQREVRRNSPIRRAGTCCGHRAGASGVELFGELVSRGRLVEADGGNQPIIIPTAC
ncbi:MAG: hypothetical protein IIB16_02470 [Chloroflexi bacterium]|nr:hypothetical protein [Chloroflexota bacterium]